MADLSPFPLDEGSTPDEELNAAAASALAAAGGTPSIDQEPEPLGMTWLFDFERGRFIRRGGAPLEVYGISSLAIWAQTAIRTPRLGFAVFSDEFGVDDPEGLVGHLDIAERIADYEESRREALTVHDRIADIANFVSSVDGDVVTVKFEIITDAGENLALEESI